MRFAVFDMAEHVNWSNETTERGKTAKCNATSQLTQRFRFDFVEMKIMLTVNTRDSETRSKLTETEAEAAVAEVCQMLTF